MFDIVTAGLMVSSIFWVHFISDFVLQSHRMATGKSSDNWILTEHVCLYIMPFLILFGWRYALVNGILHWITDYFSSRKSKKYFAAGDYHNGFVVVGFDQAVHMTCLFSTLFLVRSWW